MTHVTCRLTAKHRDQVRNLMLDNWAWATFTFTFYLGLVISTLFIRFSVCFSHTALCECRLMYIIMKLLRTWNIQGGTPVETVDRWCFGTHSVTKYLPHTDRVTASLPQFLWRWRMVKYVRLISAAVCHIRWSKCNVCYWQDSEAKVKFVWSFLTQVTC